MNKVFYCFLSLFIFMNSSSFAANMYVYKNKNGEVLLVNSNKSDEFRKKVKVTDYRDSQLKDYDRYISNIYKTELEDKKRKEYEPVVIINSPNGGTTTIQRGE